MIETTTQQVYALYADGHIARCPMLAGLPGEQTVETICRSMDAARLPHHHLPTTRPVVRLVAAQVIDNPDAASSMAADCEAGIKYVWTPGDWDTVRKQHGIPYALNGIVIEGL